MTLAISDYRKMIDPITRVRLFLNGPEERAGQPFIYNNIFD